MSGLEDAVNQLKEEGFSSDQIKDALKAMVEESKSEGLIENLDEYLDSLKSDKLNALQVAQRINILCRELEGINFMINTLRNDRENHEDRVESLLQKESSFLDELKLLQDKLESIDIVW